MKIYTRIVFDMETMQVLEEESFEYEGPLVLAEAVVVAGVIIAALALIVSTVGAITSADNQRRMANYNADLAAMQADERRKEAAFRAEREAEKNEALKARQRLAFNLAGVTPEGTPTDLLMDTTKKMELDALAIRYGGASSGSSLETQAQLSRMQGQAAGSAGWWNAGSGLLSGATKMQAAYGSYDKYDAQRGMY